MRCTTNLLEAKLKYIHQKGKKTEKKEKCPARCRPDFR